jgi:nucleotide-binding universal stress UspA family protein
VSVHVIVATDGSRQSLTAARQLKALADPGKVTDVTVVAVVSPLATVPFVDELSPPGATRGEDPTGLRFRDEAESATGVVMAEFADWPARVHRQVRSGSPASEIVAAAKELRADLVVVASGGQGLSETVLLGSTAQRVQHSAPCPVLVSRPTQRSA